VGNVIKLRAFNSKVAPFQFPSPLEFLAKELQGRREL
jgi:hypothetical protein